MMHGCFQLILLAGLPLPGATPAQAGTNGSGTEPHASTTRPSAAEPSPTKAPSRRKTTRNYDGVLAMVGNRVVTLSSIRDRVKLLEQEELLRLRRQDPNAALTPDIQKEILTLVLQKEVQDLLMAERYNRLPMPQEQLEAILDREVRREEELQRRQAGSSHAFIESLDRLGMSIKEFREEKRLSFKNQLAWSADRRRLLADISIKITPRELRNYYLAHREDFEMKPSAKLLVLDFEDREGERPAVERAREAVGLLAAGRPAAEVAAKLGAGSTNRELSPDGADLKFLRDFAFDASREIGSHSEPVPIEDRVYLLQLVSREGGGPRQFVDRSVQAEIRQRIITERYRRLSQRVERENRLRSLSIWPRDLFRRR
ncbi:MAG: hypothetical protein ACE5F1_18150 [Planctomycetota bacterium]